MAKLDTGFSLRSYGYRKNCLFPRSWNWGVGRCVGDGECPNGLSHHCGYCQSTDHRVKDCPSYKKNEKADFKKGFTHSG